ncbi:MAG TPA: hypothetical protein VIM53_00590 [Candidatus Saccharimonadales bacterium]
MAIPLSKLFENFHVTNRKDKSPSQKNKSSVKGDNNVVNQSIINSPVVNNINVSQHANDPKLKLTKITPLAIVEDIDSRPPMQQTTAAKAYRGQHVRWRLEFRAASPLLDGKHMITFRQIGEPIVPSVTCVIRTGEYPQLNIAPRGTKIVVDGTIRSVEGYTIRLENFVLEFDE